MLPTYAWRHSQYTNFGDELNFHLLGAIVGHTVHIVRDSRISPKLLAIGSVLSTWHARPGDVVWGAGYRGDGPVAHRDLDIRAVRGPMTACHLAEVGYPPISCFGDPALLLPRFFSFPIGGGGIGFVAHHQDPLPNDFAIDVRRPPLEVVAAIAACDRVISSSLHGIIVAEAYGIPAILASGLEVRNARIKFDDYYASTGRYTPPPISFSSATLADAPEKPRMPDLDALLAAFPHDKMATESGVPVCRL
ncbi:MAG: polysaccharide pyruvyl transferase family protein [Chthoniobacter sp.]